MRQQEVIVRDLGRLDYQSAWDYQEQLLKENVRLKTEARENGIDSALVSTSHYFLFVEHPPVYTLGKSGNKENVLLDDEGLKQRNIQFFNTNRGGDITFHGPDQIVGYPIIDLEKAQPSMTATASTRCCPRAEWAWCIGQPTSCWTNRWPSR